MGGCEGRSETMYVLKHYVLLMMAGENSTRSGKGQRI